jgi:D-cysteine desulfhydrase
VLGSYPTTVQKLEALSNGNTEFWVKRDDAAGRAYGGNKVRKLEKLLAKAIAQGARRTLTFGPAGSHLVVATSFYGPQLGLKAAAILTSQPFSDHAVDNLRVGVAQGLEPYGAPSFAHLPIVFARARRKGDFIIGPGASNPLGASGFVDAARELDAQIKSGLLPAPDLIVVACGSGGTAAGLLAGMTALNLPTKVLAVRVVSALFMGRWRVLWLARRIARTCGFDVSLSRLGQALQITGDFVGPGYGRETVTGREATRVAAALGLTLDPTYTSKAFAAALDVVRSKRVRRVLYWHTLSSAPLDAVLKRAPPLEALPYELRRLFSPGSLAAPS